MGTAANPGGVCLALSTGQGVDAEILGLLPHGAVADLDQAHRNRDATIYRVLPAAAPVAEEEPGQAGGGANMVPTVPGPVWAPTLGPIR